ncbi:STAS domain-containing protein [Sorangium sp. So ce367]|uniref:STAS domain-containing protein n=1 Tax=Sorangium sp. So ce367 TaxID=3133305 RepID=UPI003F604520
MNKVETALTETVADPERARRELEERGREIDCLHAILNPDITEKASLEELFQHTVDLVPLAFGDPEATSARAKIGERAFLTKSFRETAWVLAQDIVLQGQAIGAVEVHCREEHSLAGGDAFSKGKRYFLEIVAARLGELVRRGLAEDAQRREEAELRERLEYTERQLQAVRSSSLPVLEVWDKVLMVPVFGSLDLERVAELMDRLLPAISSKRARFVIIDVGGVESIDTASVGQLYRLAASVRMLGASYILAGIKPEVAQTLVSLDVDLAEIKSCASLCDGLRECLRQMGVARVTGMLVASIFRM